MTLKWCIIITLNGIQFIFVALHIRFESSWCKLIWCYRPNTFQTEWSEHALNEVRFISMRERNKWETMRVVRSMLRDPFFNFQFQTFKSDENECSFLHFSDLANRLGIGYGSVVPDALHISHIRYNNNNNNEENPVFIYSMNHGNRNRNLLITWVEKFDSILKSQWHWESIRGFSFNLLSPFYSAAPAYNTVDLVANTVHTDAV